MEDSRDRANLINLVSVRGAFPVEFEGFKYEGQIAYTRGAEKRPLILVFPNYAGMKQFGKWPLQKSKLLSFQDVRIHAFIRIGILV
jgi:hypothetical protein